MSIIAEEPDDNPTGLPTPRPIRLTERERREIIAERFAGVAVKDIAQRFKVNPITVWRICKGMQESAAKASDDWRSEMRSKAVKAVNAGLTAKEDPYKRGNLGVNTLKGLGEFKGENEVSIVTLVSSPGVERVAGLLETYRSPLGDTTTPCDDLTDNGAT